MKSRRLQAVFAHSDDETLLAGPLLAMLASEGTELQLLCVAPGDLARSERLDRAARILGIASVTSLRYDPLPDRAGTYDLRSVIEQARVVSEPVAEEAPPAGAAPLEDLVGRIAGRIDAFQPDAVLTHSPYGEYFHPDHVRTHIATVRAFDLAGLRGSSLYCLSYPRWLIRTVSAMRRFTHAGRSALRTEPLMSALVSIPASTHSVNVRRFVGQRKKAAREYAPEIAAGPLILRGLEAMPPITQAVVLGKARLARLRPRS